MKQITGSLVGSILRVLPTQVAKEATDAFLDVIEKSVKESSNKVDDIVVLPLCQIIRKAIKIED